MAALIHTMAVTSCAEGDGKTSVALGLAATLPRRASGRWSSTPTSGDGTRPRCSESSRPAGLAEWLEAQRRAPFRSLRIAPTGLPPRLGGRRPRAGPELLGSSRMLRLLSALERRFDRIILDCAPVLPVADTLALSDRVGGFILVVRSQHTQRESLVRVASLLGVDRLLGLILNGYVEPAARGTPAYGYGYGQGYGSPLRSERSGELEQQAASRCSGTRSRLGRKLSTAGRAASGPRRR